MVGSPPWGPARVAAGPHLPAEDVRNPNNIDRCRSLPGTGGATAGAAAGRPDSRFGRGGSTDRRCVRPAAASLSPHVRFHLLCQHGSRRLCREAAVQEQGEKRVTLMGTRSVPPFRPSPLLRLYAWLAHRIDLSSGWDRLPRYTGAAVLGGLRTQLRRKNLYDTSQAPNIHASAPIARGDGYLTARTVDGSFNDLQVPSMGRAGERFGRNVPLRRAYPQREELLLTPNPRQVSRRLLTRETFIPATSLN